MALIKCTECGHMISDRATKCPKCGCQTKKDGTMIVPRNLKMNIPVVPFQSSPGTYHQTNQYQKGNTEEHERSNKTLVLIIVALTILIAGVGGYFYYDKIYLPEKIDNEAPRYYTVANVVVLRSSQSSGADFNKVASLPFGTELITYEHGQEWSRVKVNSATGEKQEGFVASSYIMNKSDFFLLNSIFGNQNSRETIITTKCKIALLNYFKERGYIGKIDDKMRTDAGISVTPNSNNQWQVFTKPKDAKPNSVLYKRLYNGNSQFTDFAVIITNIVSKERKLLYFYFDNDETPHLLVEQKAPSDGYIRDIALGYSYYGSSRELNVNYSY